MPRKRLSAHIPVTESTRDRLRDYCAGACLTYDETIALLLGEAVPEGVDPFTAGRQRRDGEQDHELAQAGA